MATFQQIIDDARIILNDEYTDSNTVLRYTASQLLVYARQAVIESRRIRPDLFLSNLTGSFPVFAETDTVPMPDEYHAAIADYIAHRAEMRDDEFEVDGRASSLFMKFKSGLTGL
jgi:hypothetical protein